MRWLIYTTFILLSLTTLTAQVDSEDEYCSHNNLNLGIIGIGNSKDFDGLRLNWSDCDLGTVNGINFTMWSPKENEEAIINGLAIGLFPQAKNITGLSFGLLGMMTYEEQLGINIAGLANVSEGRITGINFAGLALVSDDEITGVNISGLANVSSKSITGFNFGGLALVSQEDMTGINIGGLANVAQGEMRWFNFASLALVSQKDMLGFNFAGAACVSQGSILGLNFGGLALVSENEGITGFNATAGGLVAKSGKIKGLNIAGYKVEAKEVTGLNIAGVMTKAYDFYGVSISLYNGFHNTQNGLALGLWNFAEILNGIQIGLINIAENNPAPFKVLPFVNAHF